MELPGPDGLGGTTGWGYVEPMADGDPLRAFMNTMPELGDLHSPGAPAQQPQRRVVGGMRRSSSRPRQSEDERRRLEEQRQLHFALESAASEFCLHPALNASNPPLTPEDHRKLIGLAIPTKEHIRGRERDIRTVADFAARAEPEDEDDASDASDYEDDDDDPKVFARKCFKGTAVPSAELEGLSNRERFANFRFLSSAEAYEDEAVGVWVRPPAEEHYGGKYFLSRGCYGERLGLDNELTAAGRAFDRARAEHQKLYNECCGTGGTVGAPSLFGQPTRVTSIDDGITKMRRLLDNPVTVLERQLAQRVRANVLQRFKFLNEGRNINTRIQGALDTIRANHLTPEQCAERNIPTLLTTFTTEDLMMAVANNLGPYDARRLLGSCKWGPDIAALLKSRMPQLHIFKIPQVFPHYTDPGGIGYNHTQAQLKIAVGLTYTKKRETEADMKDPGYENRPGVQTFAACNTHRGARNSASYEGFEQPWNAEMRRTTIHPHEFFTEPPTLKITLIDAITNLPVVPYSKKDRHGGMVPDKVMGNIESQGMKPRLYWTDRNVNPSEHIISMRNEDFAVMSRFRTDSDSLSSRLGSKYKIRASATGVSWVTGQPLVLRTESEVFTLVSSLAVAKSMSTKAKGATKRKRQSAAGPSKRR